MKGKSPGMSTLELNEYHGISTALSCGISFRNKTMILIINDKQ